MTEAADALRGYLRGREALGVPEIFLSGASRDDVLDAVRGVVSQVQDQAPVGTDVGRIATEGTRADILGISNMENLRRVADACSRCGLHSTRTKVVFADGSAEARVLCVGEAPGANEDRTGLPFVGRAGKLLDRLLLSVGFSRSEVFICNVLKCRPPGNRNPLPEEIEACSPFLLRQVELVRPAVIVAFGTFAAQTLLGTRDSLRHLRGRTHLYEGFPLVVTYHPAALLRNPGWTRPTWRDLQLARRIVDGDHGGSTLREPVESASATRPDEPGSPAGEPDQLTLGGRDG
ncbi:MAG: uracil-DNA glycosylase [Gemmatimonadota bacterium]